GGSGGSVGGGLSARSGRGDRFQCAGRTSELVGSEGMVAYVRRAKGGDGPVATWQGGRMPLSTQSASEVESSYSHPGAHPEMRAVAPSSRIQAQASALPDRGRSVAERIGTRRGMHSFSFPFAGRAVHEDIAAMIASRWGRRQTNTISY
ncbi:hypothetical protein OY671_012641, partial [Metschnikowia pulcherrima]